MPGAATALVTFAEFEQMPDVEGFRLELHDGEVVQVPPPKLGHSIIQHNLLNELKVAFGPDVFVGLEVGFRAGDRTYLVPDVVAVPRQRFRSFPRDGYIVGAPEIVIEVLSPSNTVSEMNAKEQLCLENGTLEFWVIDPERRQVKISTSDGRFTVYKSGQTIALRFGGNLAVDSVFAD